MTYLLNIFAALGLNRSTSLMLSSCLLVIITGLTSNTVFAAKPESGPQQVIVAAVIHKQIADRIEALGTARANESLSITSNVSEKINTIHFEDGQQVKAGETLIVLKDAEEQANLKLTQAVLGERKLALDRTRRLAKQKLVPPEELDKARLAHAQASASINAIQARIDDRIIKAPFDGVVGLRQLSIGALVESGDQVATLDDTHIIKLDFSVPAVFLPELKLGLPIEATADAVGKQVYTGKVSSIDSRVDPVSRSVKVRALLPNPDGKIIPGILMQVQLLRNVRQALVIPEAALLPLADKQFVMLQVNNQDKLQAQKREIKIGTRTPGWVEVIDGLSLNEMVITHGNSKVRNGSAIKVLAIDDGSKDISTIIKGKTIKGKQR